MHFQIHTKDFDNPEIESWMRNAIMASSDIIPAWVNDIRVVNIDCSDGWYLQVYCAMAYREIKIEVALPWCQVDEKRRNEMVRHELVHGILSPMSDYVIHQLIEPIRERNEELYHYINGEYRQRMESVTQEITFLFDRLYAQVDDGRRLH